MTIKKKKTISPYLLVLLSFMIVIFLGGFLLTLPIAHKDGAWGSFIDALFNATSATCVTGLSTYAKGIGGELSLFGQITMIVLIQVGGLGFITLVTFFITLFTKMQFKNRFYLSQAVNSSNVADVGKFVRKIMIIAFGTEFIGFLIGLPVFFNMKANLPGMTVGDVIWYSIFTSISMYNNAGFDLFGATSLIRNVGNMYVDALSSWANNLMDIYVMLLIVSGGISFLVVLDVFSFKKTPSQWRLFTKIVLSTTIVLIIGGMSIFLLTDGLKDTTPMSAMEALFQSVTCRTAGAATYDQALLSPAGKAVSCFLMFVGGSPLSTAGGIKTTTLFLIVLAVFCYLRGKRVVCFKRAVSQNMIVKAMSLLIIGATLVSLSFLIMINLEKNNPIGTSDNVIFEIFSAFGTVGLSASLTPTICLGSKIILIMLMFLGRIGPMTVFQIVSENMDKEDTLHFKYIEEDFLVG